MATVIGRSLNNIRKKLHNITISFVITDIMNTSTIPVENAMDAEATECNYDIKF
jgi:hypothetical protein